MKRNILHSLLVAGVVALAASSCSEDDLSSTSVIVPSQTEQTPLDKWLKVNYLDPYNIEIKYRYEYNETSSQYYTVPAEYKQAVELAHIVKYSCVEAYDEVAGIDFTRRYFPKLFFFVGEWHYNNNNTIELGSAEGGKKINLMGVNYIDQYKTNVAALNQYYLKTIHHEFTHILNQTIDYSAAYQLITSKGYLADQWSVAPNDTGYLHRGFITSYAQHSHGEDFAEMLSTYVTNTPEAWDAMMKEAEGPNKEFPGRGYLESKLQYVRDYMLKNFNIDIDKLRDSVLRREQDIADGKIDLTDVSINGVSNK